MYKLSHKELVALNRAVLGGVEGLRTESYHVDSKTVGALMKKGYFDKYGVTEKGLELIRGLGPDAPMSNPPAEPPVWLEEFLSVGGQLTADGRRAVVFHATTKAKAARMLAEKIMRAPTDAPDSYGVYVSSSPDVVRDYGDGTLIGMEVKLADLHPDDVFPGLRLDFSIPTKNHAYRPARLWLEG